MRRREMFLQIRGQDSNQVVEEGMEFDYVNYVNFKEVQEEEQVERCKKS